MVGEVGSIFKKVDSVSELKKKSSGKVFAYFMLVIVMVKELLFLVVKQNVKKWLY